MMEESCDYPPFINVENTGDILPLMVNFACKVNESIGNCREKRGVLVGTELINSLFLDIPFLILAIDCKDKTEFLIRNIFVSNIQALESQTSIGAHLYGLLINQMVRRLRKDIIAKEPSAHKSKNELIRLSSRARASDLHDILAPLINDPQAIDIFDTSIKLAGCDGQITIKNDVKKFDTTIEMSEMFSFNFGLDNNFTRNVGLLSREVKRA